MNIDLLFTDAGIAGFVADKNFQRKVCAILLDKTTGALEFELADNSDPIILNINVDSSFLDGLSNVYFPFVGSIKNSNIAQAYQAPLLIMGDSMHSQMASSASQEVNPLAAFSNFLKLCTKGQPVHRSDIEDENSSCVLGGASPASLEFAPHLAQQHSLEASPRNPIAAPRMGGLGLGVSSTSSGGRTSTQGDD